MHSMLGKPYLTNHGFFKNGLAQGVNRDRYYKTIIISAANFPSIILISFPVVWVSFPPT